LELYIPTDNEKSRKQGKAPIEPEKDRTRKLRQLGFTIAYNKSDSTYGYVKETISTYFVGEAYLTPHFSFSL